MVSGMSNCSTSRDRSEGHGSYHDRLSPLMHAHLSWMSKSREAHTCISVVTGEESICEVVL